MRSLKKLLAAGLLAGVTLAALVAPARAASKYWSLDYGTNSGTATLRMAGVLKVSSNTTNWLIDNFPGAVFISSGSVLFQSTSATAAHYVLRVNNNAGTELFRVQQDGKVGVSSATPTDALSVTGFINTTSGLKVNNTTGSSASLSAGQALCGATYTAGIPTGGTACSAGSGDAVLSATQTFSGANLFTSSAAAGPQVYTSTATTGTGAVIAQTSVWVNTWMVVASTAVHGSTITVIHGLQPNIRYRLSGFMVFAANVNPKVRFNQDASLTVYKWSAHRTSEGSAASAVGDDSDSECELVTETVDDADPFSFHLEFRTMPGDGTRLAGFGQWTGFIADNTVLIGGYNSCHYDGAASLTSVAFHTGGHTGTLVLEQLVVPSAAP